MAVNLKVRVGKITFPNPVLVASGTFGYAEEFASLAPLGKLGGIVTKTLTVRPRLGNPPPRIVETPSGMLNAIGLQNVGVDAFVKEKLPYLRRIGVPVVASVMGYSVEEFEQAVGVLEKAPGIDGYELNLSCPNVSYGTGAKPTSVRMFAHDPALIRAVVSTVREATSKTLIAKLGPDVSDIGAMASAAESAGADAVSLVNTFTAMVVDVKNRRPVLANKTGGLSGPCIRPIAVRLVWEAARRVRVPVIGIGGITETDDALQFLIAGATAVQVGTATFVNPAAATDLVSGLERYLKQQKLKDWSTVIGSIRTDS